MKIIVSFILKATGVEINNCECEVEHIDKFYKADEFIEIHGDVYKIIETIPSINGHVLYKVYLV